MSDPDKSKFESGMEWLKGDSYESIFDKYNNALKIHQDPVNKALITLDFFQEMKRFYLDANGTFNEAIVQKPDSCNAYFYKGLSSLFGSISFFGSMIFGDAMARMNTASILNRDDPLTI